MNECGITAENFPNYAALEEQGAEVCNQVNSLLQQLGGYKLYSVGYDGGNRESCSVFYDDIVAAKTDSDAIDIAIYQAIKQQYPNSIPTQAEIDEIEDQEWYSCEKEF
jgi:hypothetical protein